MPKEGMRRIKKLDLAFYKLFSAKLRSEMRPELCLLKFVHISQNNQSNLASRLCSKKVYKKPSPKVYKKPNF